MTTFVYKQTEPGLWTVGHYWNDGTRDHWEPASDHSSTDEAAARVRFLNGGRDEAAGLALYNVNEDGAIYGRPESLAAAVAKLREFPNDSVVLRYEPDPEQPDSDGPTPAQEEGWDAREDFARGGHGDAR